MKQLISLILSFLFSLPILAQDFGSWTPYTSFRTIQDVTVDTDGVIYVSTLGGIFVYDDGLITNQFTTIDGLARLDSERVIYDNENNRLIIGYIDGGIDLLDISTGNVQFIGDIQRAENFSPRGINDLIIVGSNLYVATDFGIVNYDLDQFVVRESFTILGRFDRGIPVNDISITGDSIYAATATGIASAGLNLQLEFADNWNNYDSSNGFIDDPIQALESFNGRIYATSNTQNYEFDGLNWLSSSNFNQGVIREYNKSSDYLYAVDRDQVFKLDNGGSLTVQSLGEEVATTIEFRKNSPGNEQALIGTLNEGLAISNQNLEINDFISPDGPFQNIFDDLKFEGDLLIASSTNESDRNSDIDRGKGYYLFENNSWSNFNAQNNATINAAGYQQAFRTVFTPDFYYFGSWGRGIARHDRLTNEILIFDETNSTIRGWEADDVNFPVISGLATDSNNDVWAVSRWAQNPIYYQVPGDDDWVNLPPAPGISTQDEHFGLFIDSFDQKWIGVQATNLSGRGLIVMRTGDPRDPSDDEGVKLTDDINRGFLPNLQVKAIIEDKNREVWVGTERGIGRYIFPELIIDGGADERRAQFLINEDTSAVSRVLLRDVNVSALAVNSANQKWVGSENQGLYLINDAGSRIIKQFTTENSPLFSNSIKSIAVQESTGMVFIATDKGLLSFQDVPTQPVLEMDELRVYPNPFRYDRSTEVFIDGLSEQTTLRVLGSDGTLVAQFESFGGRTSWDGRDGNGNRLASGVYFIIALDDNGREKGIGKIAIIK